jgi:hypothetical protein
MSWVSKRNTFKNKNAFRLASGVFMRPCFNKSSLEKIELEICQRYLVDEGDGMAKEAVLDRYYLDGTQVKREVSYTKAVDYNKLKPVAADSAGTTPSA